VFSDEMNQALEEMVSELEVLVAFTSMQKGKSLGPGGLTIEFFIGFYDLIK
jgi:hypothetical protein